jgi:hypothetical protein
MAVSRGARAKAKTGRCTPKQHAAAASHRAAEAKWVRKNKSKHQAAARAYYHKNKAKVKAQRKAAKTASHQAQLKARRRSYGGNIGRPREC